MRGASPSLASNDQGARADRAPMSWGWSPAGRPGAGRRPPELEVPTAWLPAASSCAGLAALCAALAAHDGHDLWPVAAVGPALTLAPAADRLAPLAVTAWIALVCAGLAVTRLAASLVGRARGPRVLVVAPGLGARSALALAVAVVGAAALLGVFAGPIRASAASPAGLWALWLGALARVLGALAGAALLAGLLERAAGLGRGRALLERLGERAEALSTRRGP